MEHKVEWFNRRMSIFNRFIYVATILFSTYAYGTPASGEAFAGSTLNKAIRSKSVRDVRFDIVFQKSNEEKPRQTTVVLVQEAANQGAGFLGTSTKTYAFFNRAAIASIVELKPLNSAASLVSLRLRSVGTDPSIEALIELSERMSVAGRRLVLLVPKDSINPELAQVAPANVMADLRPEINDLFVLEPRSSEFLPLSVVLRNSELVLSAEPLRTQQKDGASHLLCNDIFR